MENKRGQMTIWIIVAIAIVIAIVLFLLFRGKISPIVSTGVNENPKSFIGSCVKKNVNEAVDKMLPQGGFITPRHAKLYKDINVSYLCFNSGNYFPCVNEHPMLLSEMEKELKEFIEPKIEKCFQDYKKEIEKQIEVEMKEMNLSVKLGAENIYVNIDREVSIKQKEDSSIVRDFNAKITSPLYNIARVAMEIASQEAEYCYFEYVGYMTLYPKFKISLDTMSDSTKLYTIQDKRSKKEMNIAIRSCAIPAGI